MKSVSLPFFVISGKHFNHSYATIKRILKKGERKRKTENVDSLINIFCFVRLILYDKSFASCQQLKKVHKIG